MPAPQMRPKERKRQPVAWLALAHLTARERPRGLAQKVSLRPSPR